MARTPPPDAREHTVSPDRFQHTARTRAGASTARRGAAPARAAAAVRRRPGPRAGAARSPRDRPAGPRLPAGAVDDAVDRQDLAVPRRLPAADPAGAEVGAVAAQRVGWGRLPGDPEVTFGVEHAQPARVDVDRQLAPRQDAADPERGAVGRTVPERDRIGPALATRAVDARAVAAVPGLDAQHGLERQAAAQYEPSGRRQEQRRPRLVRRRVGGHGTEDRDVAGRDDRDPRLRGELLHRRGAQPPPGQRQRRSAQRELARHPDAAAREQTDRCRLRVDRHAHAGRDVDGQEREVAALAHHQAPAARVERLAGAEHDVVGRAEHTETAVAGLDAHARPHAGLVHLEAGREAVVVAVGAGAAGPLAQRQAAAGDDVPGRGRRGQRRAPGVVAQAAVAAQRDAEQVAFAEPQLGAVRALRQGAEVEFDRTAGVLVQGRGHDPHGARHELLDRPLQQPDLEGVGAHRRRQERLREVQVQPRRVGGDLQRKIGRALHERQVARRRPQDRGQPRRALVDVGDEDVEHGDLVEPASVLGADRARPRIAGQHEPVAAAGAEGTVVELRPERRRRAEREPVLADVERPGHLQPVLVEQRHRVRRHAERQDRVAEVDRQRVVQQHRRVGLAEDRRRAVDAQRLRLGPRPPARRRGRGEHRERESGLWTASAHALERHRSLRAQAGGRQTARAPGLLPETAAGRPSERPARRARPRARERGDTARASAPIGCWRGGSRRSCCAATATAPAPR